MNPNEQREYDARNAKTAVCLILAAAALFAACIVLAAIFA